MMKKVLMSVVSTAAMVASSAESVRYEAAKMSLEERSIVATGVELHGELKVTRGPTIALEEVCGSTKVRFLPE